MDGWGGRKERGSWLRREGTSPAGCVEASAGRPSVRGLHNGLLARIDGSTKGLCAVSFLTSLPLTHT